MDEPRSYTRRTESRNKATYDRNVKSKLINSELRMSEFDTYAEYFEAMNNAGKVPMPEFRFDLAKEMQVKHAK